MHETAPALQAPETSWLQPSWLRLGFAVIVAWIGFLLPQEVPLEWYPLNNPGTDINYLEISCAADVTGTVRILYDVGGFGSRNFDNITIPIAPSTQTFTYSFPLPDAPIVEMRVYPPRNGALTIRQMRIVNRRNEEIRRFTRDLFRPLNESTTLEAIPAGWKIVTKHGVTDAAARIELFSQIIPAGKDHRNFMRCVLSTGYLAMMLFILLMAVLTATCRPSNWRDFFVHTSFMAGVALLFAPVGNRGLIKNSFAYTKFQPPPPNPALKLEFDLATDHPDMAQLFWDDGEGYSEANSIRTRYEPHHGLQTLRFALPHRPHRAIRFDPLDGAANLTIRGIRVVDGGQNTRAVLSLEALRAVREVAIVDLRPEELRLATTGDARDPILEFTPEAMAKLNTALAGK